MEHEHGLTSTVSERQVLRKLDRHLLPLVFALFTLSFLDRSNVGNAKTAGMTTDLHFDANGKGPHTYDWLLTIFYISYILFEFLIMGWKLVPPHIWGACVTFSWGLISTMQAATFNWSGMMALRFLLGVSEAAYGPGIVYYLTFFYLRTEVGFRQGIFLSGAPLATCFAGALAYAITHERDTRHIAPWRLLFMVEGIPTILMAPIVWYFLPDDPQRARFLTSEEKAVAAKRTMRQVGNEETRFTGEDSTSKRKPLISWSDVLQTVLDPKSWLQALMYFSCNTAYGSLPVFLPTFLTESLGFSAINAQGLTAPPYFLSFLITIATPFLADKIQQRGLIIALLSCIGGTGYILLATVQDVWVRYFAVFLAAAGVFPAIANILPWVTNNQGNDTGRGIAVVILNLVGQCGPVLGTNMYPTTDAPGFVKGHAVCAGFLFFNALLALTLRTYLAWCNRRWDGMYGTVEEQKARGSRMGSVVPKGEVGQEGEVVGHDEKKIDSLPSDEVATEEYGPMFRYIL